MVNEVLSQENRDRDPEQTTDQKRQQRAVERSPDLGKNAESILAGMPSRAGDEPNTMLANRRQGLNTQRPQDVGDQSDDESSASPSKSSKNNI